MTLQSPDRKRSIGTLGLQLQMKGNASQARSKIADSREMVENARSKLVQGLNTNCSQRTSNSLFLSPPNNVGSESPEPDGLQALSRIRRRLGSMKSGKLRTSLDLVDKAAKVCSYLTSRKWRRLD